MINLVGGGDFNFEEKKNEGFVAWVWNLSADKHKGSLFTQVFLTLLNSSGDGECCTRSGLEKYR